MYIIVGGDLASNIYEPAQFRNYKQLTSESLDKATDLQSLARTI